VCKRQCNGEGAHMRHAGQREGDGAGVGARQHELNGAGWERWCKGEGQDGASLMV